MTPVVEIVHLPAAALAALAAGDRAAAEAAAGLPLSAYLVGPESVGTWRRRRDQVAADPGEAAWVTGVVWDVARGAAVGRAGFHGRPDAAGVVEIGYAIDPADRRRGYAGAALGVLLDRAAREPGVRTVRLSIRPDNTPSLRLAARFGFAGTGRQWDDEDGWETVFERQAASA